MKAQSAPFLSQTIPVKQKRLYSSFSPAPHCSTFVSTHFTLTSSMSTTGSLWCLLLQASFICVEADVKRGERQIEILLAIFSEKHIICDMCGTWFQLMFLLFFYFLSFLLSLQQKQHINVSLKRLF